jgi:hypothetical protein
MQDTARRVVRSALGSLYLATRRTLYVCGVFCMPELVAAQSHPECNAPIELRARVTRPRLAGAFVDSVSAIIQKRDSIGATVVVRERLHALLKRDSAATTWALARIIGDADGFASDLAGVAAGTYRRLRLPAEPILVELLGKGDDTRQGLALGAIERLATSAEDSVVLALACDASTVVRALASPADPCQGPHWSFDRNLTLRRSRRVLLEARRLIQDQRLHQVLTTFGRARCD